MIVSFCQLGTHQSHLSCGNCDWAVTSIRPFCGRVPGNTSSMSDGWVPRSLLAVPPWVGDCWRCEENWLSTPWRTSQQAEFIQGVCFSFYLEFLPWFPFMVGSALSSPGCFWSVFYHSNGNKTKAFIMLQTKSPKTTRTNQQNNDNFNLYKIFF